MSQNNWPQDKEFFDFLIEEATHPFSGWDFSHITTTRRMVESPLSWSYTSNILMQLRHIQSLLDMGTGGGEFLSSLHPLPKHTCATEGYAPNVPVAQQRLEPLGIKVYQVDDPHHLPFAECEFDLVINRHEYYDPQEVMRILKAGHKFITQQVGGSNDVELTRLVGGEQYPYARWTLDYAVNELKEAGWQIVEQHEDFPITRFFDVGAIVYYLKAIPWQVPDFSFEKYFDKLVEIHNTIQAQNYIDVHDHRFFIVAQKP
jgi:SAM-dependent methyltransferase